MPLSVPKQQPLVVRLPNAVGDVVMTEPTLDWLTQQGFEVHAIGPGWAPQLLSHLDARLYPLPSSSQEWADLREGTAASDALLFRSSFRSSQELRSAGFRCIGFRTDMRSLLLWKSMRRPRGRHKIEEYHALATYAEAAIRGSARKQDRVRPPVIPVSAAAHQRAREKTNARNLEPNEPYVVCCPTVSGRHPAGFKLWPHFPTFYQLLENENITAVTCPGPEEEERLAACQPRGHVVPGATLDELAAILQGARAVVSNDTGTMHLATATGTPTLGLFGDTSPQRYYPYGENGHVLGEKGAWPEVEEVLGWVRAKLEANRMRR